MTDGRSQTGVSIPPEVGAFLEGGLIMFLGSRGAGLEPESILVSGAHVDAAGERLTVFVADVLAGPTLANLRANGQAALTASRVTDDRSIQLKGVYLGDRPAGESDRAVLDPMLARRLDAMAEVGMPRSVTARLVDWPAHAVDLRVEEIFEQTPGPHAGEKLEEPIR